MWEDIKREREEDAKATPVRRKWQPSDFENQPAATRGLRFGELLHELIAQAFAVACVSPGDVSQALLGAALFWDRHARKPRKFVLDLLATPEQSTKTFEFCTRCRVELDAQIAALKVEIEQLTKTAEDAKSRPA